MTRREATRGAAGVIRPLPAHVAAQIQSAATITSLAGVVVELLKNALDAGATKVEATADLARGSCSVEDNGRGIAPVEFEEGGALGRPYRGFPMFVQP
jgi:DNA mismatch repair protein MLH3